MWSLTRLGTALQTHKSQNTVENHSTTRFLPRSSASEIGDSVLIQASPAPSSSGAITGARGAPSAGAETPHPKAKSSVITGLKACPIPEKRLAPGFDCVVVEESPNQGAPPFVILVGPLWSSPMSKPPADQSPKATPTDLDSMLQSGFRFAYSLTHHRQDAEDLVQRAWLRLQRRYAGCDSLPLMFTTLRNLFYDDCRRAKIVPFTTLDDELGATPTVEVALAHAPGVQGDLETLLGMLEVAEREALYLNCIEGMTAKEIGELTGRPRNTVLSVLARAQRKLRDAAARDGATKVQTTSSP